MSYWVKATYKLGHLLDFVDIKIFTWICLSLHISLINLHLFSNLCHPLLFHYPLYSLAFPISANSFWEADLNAIWCLSLYPQSLWLQTAHFHRLALVWAAFLQLCPRTPDIFITCKEERRMARNHNLRLPNNPAELSNVFLNPEENLETLKSREAASATAASLLPPRCLSAWRNIEILKNWGDVWVKLKRKTSGVLWSRKWVPASIQ